MKIIDLIERHKAIRRLALLWSICLITWVVIRVFSAPLSEITGPATTALGIVVGLLATVVGFYQHSRNRNDQTNEGNDN